METARLPIRRISAFFAFLRGYPGRKVLSVRAAPAFTIEPLNHGERGEMGLAVATDVAVGTDFRLPGELHGLRSCGCGSALSDRRLVADTSATQNVPV